MSRITKVINKYKTMPVQIRASFWFLICSFLQKGVSMITTPIFTRLLTTSEYGQFSIFNSWLGIVTVFVSLNLAYGVYSQGLVKFSDDKNAFSSSMQGLLTFLVLVWTFIYVLFHSFFNRLFNLTTVQMLAMLVMIWTTTVFSFWSAYQRVEYKYRALVIVTILVSIAKPVIGIVFVINANDKVTARILGLVLVELIGYCAFYFIQLRRGKKFFSSYYWKYALAYNIPLIPHYLSQIVLNSSDRIMIGKIVGNTEAGVYSLAYSLSNIMILFNTALMQTLSPWIYQKIKSNNVKDIESVAYITLIIIATVNLCLILLAPEAVAIFAPKEYYGAIWVIPPVAMSVYFMYSYDLFAKFAFYFEKTKLIMVTSVIGAILNVLLNYVFINAFGYIAAGYTTLVCYLVYSISHYILMNRVCTTNFNGMRPYNGKKLLAITITFMIVGFCLLFTYSYPIIRYGLIFIALVIAYLERKTIIIAGSKILNLRK